MKTRAVSFLLALAMILTMVPAQNLQAAESAGGAAGHQHAK